MAVTHTNGLPPRPPKADAPAEAERTVLQALHVGPQPLGELQSSGQRREGELFAAVLRLWRRGRVTIEDGERDKLVRLLDAERCEVSHR